MRIPIPPTRPQSALRGAATLLLACALVLPLASWASGWVGVGQSVREDTRCVVFGRVDSNTLYAFSGHKHYGVFRSVSTDNGVTWSAWAQTGLDEYKLYIPGATGTFGTVAEVNVVATRPNYATPLVVAGTTSGTVWRSTDHGVTWNPATGLPGSMVMDLTFTSSGLLACTYGDGVYRSVDGGASFTSLTPPIGTNQFMKAEVEPNTTNRFFAVTASSATLSGGVYRWNGSSWEDRSSGLPGWGTVQYSFTAIEAVDPSDTPAGDVKLWLGDLNGEGVFLSSDLGATWQHSCLSCDQVTWITVAPDYSSLDEHLMVGTAWGWYEHFTAGGSPSCARRLPKGLAVNSITADPNWSTSKPVIWLATSDGIRYLAPGGFPSPPSGDSELSSLDISFLEVSPSVLTDGVLYGASKQFGVFRSFDRGATFKQYMPSLELGSTGIQIQAPITALALHPTFNAGTFCSSDGATIFMATDGAGVFRSTAAGSAWEPLLAGLVSEGALHLCHLVHTPVSAPAPLYAATCNQARVFYYNGATSQWLETTNPPPGTRVTALELPPNHDGTTVRTVFVGTDQGLFSTTDGIFWTSEALPGTGDVTAVAFDPAYDGVSNLRMFAARLGGGAYRKMYTTPTWDWYPLPGVSDANVTALAVSPDFATDHALAAATSNMLQMEVGGVFVSTDWGGTWTLRVAGLGDRKVQALSVVRRANGTLRLVAGVERRRAYYLDDPFVMPFSGSWAPSTGFETTSGEIRAVYMSPAATNYGCTLNNPLDKGSDVFIGGTKGVFWSNDSGESFRPLNQWWKNADWTCPPTVNALFALVNPQGPGGNGTPTPMLLAGTDGDGLWYRYASRDPETLAWDWTEGQWVPAGGVTTGTVNAFTRENDFAGLVIRAATNLGTWTSPPSGGIIGENWAYSGLPGLVTDIVNAQVGGVGLKIPVDPQAPSGGAMWGTVSNSGVWKGIDGGKAAYDPAAVTWTEANGSGAGSLPDLDARSVVQLTAGRLLCGSQGSGVFWSDDEGVNWWEYAATTLGGLGKPVTDFLESTNGDVLCAVDSSLSGGGVFLSGDRGHHWATISDGFDAAKQTLSSLVASADDPPVYYAGTYSHGSYATTLTAEPYPAADSLSATTGPSTGGTAVTVTGTGFQSACPSDYTCPDSGPVVVFGGVDAAATFVSATELSVTSPPHPGGAVEVWVRNPDTRAGKYAGVFTYTEVSGGSPEFKVTVTVDLSSRVVVAWENAPGSGAARLFRSPKADFSARVTEVAVSGTSGSYTFTDTTGIDDYTYYYKVE